MGQKSRPYDISENLERLQQLLAPIKNINGEVDLTSLKEKGAIAFMLAITLNAYFTSGPEKELSGFGADDVIPVRIEVKGNTIEYWGRISWLSQPKDHESFKSYLDPFYGVFEWPEEELKITQVLFGDYANTDLEIDSWTATEMDWMYEINY